MSQGKGLTAVLIAGNLGYDLCSYIAGREKLWGFSISVSLITVPF